MATDAQTVAYDFQALEMTLASTVLALEIEEALTEFADARKKAGNLSDLDYEEQHAAPTARGA